MVLLLTLGLMLVSFSLIWKGSDWITDSLIPLAKKFGTSYVAITTLLVSFMLSVPEIFASVYSFLLGHQSLGLGVIVGSVMANVGLTVGLSAILRPLNVEKSVVIRDGVFLAVAAIIVLIFGSDLTYTKSEGLVLLILFIPYALNVWFFEKHKPVQHKKDKVEKHQQNLDLIGGFSFFKIKWPLLTFFSGAFALLGGSYLFSFSLVRLVDFFPLSEFVLGITLGALGPAMPNIAAAIVGTKRGYDDAAITETFGSNIFTLLVTLGFASLLVPLAIAPNVFYFNLTWMIVLHLLLIALIFKGYHYKEAALTRYEGAALVLFYFVLLIVHGIWF